MTTLRFALLALPLLACVPKAGDEPRPPFVPTSRYVDRAVEGWTVKVNRRLLDEDAALGTKALDLLAAKLTEVRRALPARAVDRLQRVPIWLGVDDGHAPCAEYHPNRDWLAANGYNPDKAKGVELGNATRFLDWSAVQPSMVLHELAHAYHDQVLGFDDPEVRAAFERAKALGRYDSVRHADGRAQRHYALTDPTEFFAETTEAAFGRNDFEPFDRAELDRFDPEALRLVERLWGVPAAAGDQ